MVRRIINFVIIRHMIKWAIVRNVIKWVVIETSTERRGGYGLQQKIIFKN